MFMSLWQSTQIEWQPQECITGQAKMKPVCELEYNKKMEAVDKADMMNDKKGKVLVESLQ